MKRKTPFFGFHETAEGAMVLTHRCRPVAVVRSEEQISAFRADLAAAADRQEVIAQWAARFPRLR
ncbi:hypothetical protein SAMN06272735_9000 [Streptomyces sp. TLI_55]|uniref:hypothetical protein n=1 Tax=Streptomyces sp. TLI_55 TaxID=1938861 RepID=UPI000BC8E14A|nr:hypothetical protein [Streptomyces sp. TLI_55]SNX88546.1 hypothetical protein SAMN06272735_9000 [Streptomyces sp. TLI_55]